MNTDKFTRHFGISPEEFRKEYQNRVLALQKELPFKMEYIRQKGNLSQRKLAILMGMDEKTVRNWEKGKFPERASQILAFSDTFRKYNKKHLGKMPKRPNEAITSEYVVKYIKELNSGKKQPLDDNFALAFVQFMIEKCCAKNQDHAGQLANCNLCTRKYDSLVRKSVADKMDPQDIEDIAKFIVKATG